MGHPELRHVRTRVRSLGQNGLRERGFGTLKYERLFPGDIPNALTLVERVADYRIECNTVRPHEATAWNRPLEVHLDRASATNPTFKPELSQFSDPGFSRLLLWCRGLCGVGR